MSAVMMPNILRMMPVVQLSEEADNVLGYLDYHGDGTHDKECGAVFGDADVEYQGYKEPYEEEGVEQVA